MTKNMAAMAAQRTLVLSLAILGLANAANGAEGKSSPAVPAKPGAQPASPAKEESAGKRQKLDCDWLSFPDHTMFKVLGLYWFEETKPQLGRMPKESFDSLPIGVKRQSNHPSGGRILLKCNTTKLALKVLPFAKGNLKGFDVYINGRLPAVKKVLGL